MTQAGTKAMHRMITLVAITLELFICLEKKQMERAALKMLCQTDDDSPEVKATAIFIYIL